MQLVDMMRITLVNSVLVQEVSDYSPLSRDNFFRNNTHIQFIMKYVIESLLDTKR